MAGLQDVIRSHGLQEHFYTDDSQGYASCFLKDISKLKATVLRCIDDVSEWMSSNRLKLNPTKTEFMWCSTPHQRHYIDNSPFIVAGVSIAPVESVRLLGVHIDSELTMSSHVSRTISSCFYQLRRMKSIRRSLPMDAAKSVINAFVISRIDYCNGLYAGIAQKQCDRLQSVLNASARFLHGGSKFDHTTPLLRDKLHWLKFRQRIAYKLCLTVFKALHGSAPKYIAEHVVPVSRNPSTRRLRSADTGCIVNPGSKKKFGERGFSVAAPAAWNELPPEVRLSP